MHSQWLPTAASQSPPKRTFLPRCSPEEWEFRTQCLMLHHHPTVFLLRTSEETPMDSGIDPQRRSLPLCSPNEWTFGSYCLAWGSHSTVGVFRNLWINHWWTMNGKCPPGSGIYLRISNLPLSNPEEWNFGTCHSSGIIPPIVGAFRNQWRNVIGQPMGSVHQAAALTPTEGPSHFAAQKKEN